MERELGRLAAAPVPPGLRQRVLGRAQEARSQTALSPWMRAAAVACGALIVAVLAIDPIAARQEAARMTALLDGRATSNPAADGLSELAEALGDQGPGLDQLARLQTAARDVARGESIRDLVMAHERLKGWLNHETSEDLN